jgi:NitT/TauT family transport system substrate-binding protein
MPTVDPEASMAIPDDLLVQLAEAPSARTIPYFSADLSGRYMDANLSVIPMEGDPSAGDPLAALAEEEGPQLYVGPAAAALRASATVVPLVQIAQVFGRTGDRIVVPASSGIASIADLAGHTITVLEGPAGESVLPELVAAGLAPDAVTIEPAPFDPVAIAAGEVEAAQVRLEDEWAQVLEQADATTGELVDPAAFTVLDLSDPAIAMPSDGIWARADWLAGHEDAATRFLAAVLGEWVSCRDDAETCAVNAYDFGALLPLQHQRWMVAAVNGLIWPADGSIGSLDAAAWDAMAARAVAAGVIEQAPAAADGMRTDLVAAAVASLGDLDVTGTGYTPETVEITLGGEDPSPAP